MVLRGASPRLEDAPAEEQRETLLDEQGHRGSQPDPQPVEGHHAAARAADAPFGIEGEVWRRVQELAAEVSRAIEEEVDDEQVQAAAQRLRDVLFTYV